MKYYLHPQAAAELDKAVEYYEECQPGLGLEFSEEVYATIARIIDYPDACQSLSENTRRCLLNRFPYGVIYQISVSNLYILAVASLH
jgi:plasmid stabilization system protein ParE